MCVFPADVPRLTFAVSCWPLRRSERGKCTAKGKGTTEFLVGGSGLSE